MPKAGRRWNQDAATGCQPVVNIAHIPKELMDGQ
jgi:hypothetical protein